MLSIFILLLLLLFRTNGRKEHLDENDFRQDYGNYFKSAILKVTWYRLCMFKVRSQHLRDTFTAAFETHLVVQDFTEIDQHTCSLFTTHIHLHTFTRYIYSGIWKAPCSWRFYGNRSTYVLIIFWVNIMNRKWVKVPGKLSVVQKYELVLWRTFHLLRYSSFSLKQT